ncbi:hypothetical protein, variant [Cryptococcus amylolentus CBS 6039]|uniref:Uncharacterized protein n=1 Tax=Cryptococcus amylolentus CBS 6039 TaxID=1295533 RepID=A0A1E3HFI9_9TREE|nr:hypothetical protein, variant [Cryptococcus amylolentus CBS 6039]ODN75097.1 hypothetical protein, variant [Cryptococcus amylolentus CBS 6039]
MSSPSVSPPPPIQRSQFAAYASFLEHLQHEQQTDLSQQLAHRWEDEDIVLSDESDWESRLSREASGRPTVVGDEYVGARVGGKRKRQQGSGETRWPVGLTELPEPPSFSEAITSFATAYIRTQSLTLPNLPDQDLSNPLLPPNLIESSEQMVREVLTKLAGVRPARVSKARKDLETLGWGDVLEVAAMLPSARAEVRKANARLRTMYTQPGPDLLSHRLKCLSERPKRPSRSDIYTSVIPKADPTLRPHVSKAGPYSPSSPFSPRKL